MNEHITLNEVKGYSRAFKLKQPITLEVEHDKFGAYVEHKMSSIIGSGENIEKAISDFCEMFEVQYENLVECDVSELHWSALNMRNSLIALVEM